MEGIKTILTEEELAQFKPVKTLLKKGEASIHHPLSVHGSYGNRSDRCRRSAVLNYFADGTFSDSDEPMLKGSVIPKVREET
ncbi:phytanoyl-CoA dioxygenase [Elysia marginata]|uniref:Phytanoyl-CoA dioxygenase n=1 Tax=Elysia marginata TaxID=1093978 RepID=A0AAV4GDH9_9GAST|nr:phytanoyl-CoA dioxygenase [Elysia marginata]